MQKSEYTAILEQILGAKLPALTTLATFKASRHQNVIQTNT